MATPFITCLYLAPRRYSFREVDLDAGAIYVVEGEDKVCVLNLSRNSVGQATGSMFVDTYLENDRVLPPMFEITSRPSCSVDDAADLGFIHGIHDIEEEVSIDEYINAFWAEGKHAIDKEIEAHCKVLLAEGCKTVCMITRQNYTLIPEFRDEGCNFSAVMYKEIGLYGTF